MYPFQIHSVALSTFASLIGPFGGFFASGFKRAFKIKVGKPSLFLSLSPSRSLFTSPLPSSYYPIPSATTPFKIFGYSHVLFFTHAWNLGRLNKNPLFPLTFSSWIFSLFVSNLLCLSLKETFCSGIRWSPLTASAFESVLTAHTVSLSYAEQWLDVEVGP